jgi:hypothetical protein
MTDPDKPRLVDDTETMLDWVTEICREARHAVAERRKPMIEKGKPQ